MMNHLPTTTKPYLDFSNCFFVNSIKPTYSVTDFTSAQNFRIFIITLIFYFFPIFGSAQNVPSTGSTTITTCSTTLYDSGGSGGNYSNNSDGYTVIYPATPGNAIRLTGSLDSRNYDYLTIYDGVGTRGAILFQNSGSGTLPTVLSTLGPITVRFTSDRFTTAGGFALNVTCFIPTPCASSPIINNSDKPTLYINSFQFVGTLNDNPPKVTVANGYADYTALTPVVKQPQGSVLNIVASALGSDGKANSGYWKAWVDYDRDGKFGFGEQVYNLTSFSTESLTFGFVIPPSTPAGIYRFRITVGDRKTFTACSNLVGETEDYSFEVIEDCAAKVNVSSVSDVSRCGRGTVTLSATGSGTGIRWYDSAVGGTIKGTGDTFETPILEENTQTIYYVEAFNATCKSVFRIPVRVTINPGTTVDFGTVPTFCVASTSGQIINAINGMRLETLLNETFDSTLGKFTADSPPGYSDTYWLNKPSGYIPSQPPYEGLAPALSSGYTGGNFAMTNADYARSSSLTNRLTLTTGLDPKNFINLTLDFDLYYFTINPVDNNNENFFQIEYSTDGVVWTTLSNPLNLPNPGTPQPNIPNINRNQGNPNIWQKISINLPPAVLNSTTFKIRFSSYSFANSSVFKESIAAVDNVKIYGTKDESALFGWSSTIPNILYKADCTTALGTTKTKTICVKPSDTQLENNVVFNITATANFTNSCTVAGTIAVKNDAKIYNTTASNVWNTGANWLPNDSKTPDINKCVIIKKPVFVNGDGLAKNVIITPGGSLTINKDRTLTVSDFIKNESTPLATNESNFIVETDGNLIQLNSTPSNSGRMTAQRLVNGLRYNPGSAVDYVYWSSPVGGQKTKNTTGNTDGFSSGTANTNFFTYRESNDRFYETGDPTFTLGKGYAVQAERNKGILPFDRLFEFKGTPNNGDIGFPLAFTNASHGYNLVGNPYPSNINFEQLHYGNSSLIWGTAWFWTNNVYTANQMGSGYTGNNYAVYNGTGGNPATYNPKAPYQGTLVPNGIIKVGQGFIVQAKIAGTLNFKNKYNDTHILRVNSKGDFYSKNSSPKNRFWITLFSPSQLSNMQLIAYVPGATDGFEQDYDAEAFDNYSDLFYSVIPGKKLVIQGKSEAFTNEDKVILGANFFQNGSYTIALENAEGIFNGSQNIYLKDKQEGIITNLSQGSYTFLATKADNTTRFEIIYKPETVLITDSKVKEGVVVYRDSDDFVVKAQHKKITSIEVFDVAGRLIYSLTPNSLQTFIPGAKLLNSIYVLKINQGGIITTKKIIK